MPACRPCACALCSLPPSPAPARRLPHHHAALPGEAHETAGAGPLSGHCEVAPHVAVLAQWGLMVPNSRLQPGSGGLPMVPRQPGSDGGSSERPEDTLAPEPRRLGAGPARTWVWGKPAHRKGAFSLHKAASTCPQSAEKPATTLGVSVTRQCVCGGRLTDWDPPLPSGLSHPHGPQRAGL